MIKEDIKTNKEEVEMIKGEIEMIKEDVETKKEDILMNRGKIWTKMDLRELLEISLLLVAGFLLQLIIPSYGAGMKPDIMLIILFLIIFMKRELYPTLTAGVVVGIIAALTTSFPSGQIPNIIEKLITSIFVLMLVKHIVDKVPKYVTLGAIGFIGTIFSGIVFLTTALVLTGIPEPFVDLFISVVIPAAIINTIGIVVLYPILIFVKNKFEEKTNNS